MASNLVSREARPRAMSMDSYCIAPADRRRTASSTCCEDEVRDREERQRATAAPDRKMLSAQELTAPVHVAVLHGWNCSNATLASSASIDNPIKGPPSSQPPHGVALLHVVAAHGGAPPMQSRRPGTAYGGRRSHWSVSSVSAEGLKPDRCLPDG